MKKQYLFRGIIKTLAGSVKYMAMTVKKHRIESFHDMQKCVHYCSVGGHLWVHDTERDSNGIANCPWMLEDKSLGEVHKFFSVCQQHRRTL